MAGQLSISKQDRGTTHTESNSFAFSDAITLSTRSTAVAEVGFWNLSKIVAAVKSKVGRSRETVNEACSATKNGKEKHTSEGTFVLFELFQRARTSIQGFYIVRVKFECFITIFNDQIKFRRR